VPRIFGGQNRVIFGKKLFKKIFKNRLTATVNSDRMLLTATVNGNGGSGRILTAERATAY
jgi:hypothetical protein